MSSSSNLVFINTNNPQEIKSSAQRRAVRSQAAKDHSQPSSSRDDAPKRRRHRKMLTVELELAVDDSETSRSESPPENTEFTTGGNERSSMFDEVPQRSQGAGPVTNMDYSPILPMGSIPGGGWTSPFVPQPEGKSVPGILSHCMFDLVPLCSDALFLVWLLVETNQAADAVGIRVDLSKMAVDIPELDLPGAKGSLQSLWFPMAISEQAALNVCKPEVLYKMKQDAITAINQGLQDPALATSDQLIGAVAKMAAYEAGFAGDEAQYHMHMKGLVKMVELRGGLGSLGLNGLLARMLLWIDLNAAFLLKTHLYFPHKKALPGQFLGAS